MTDTILFGPFSAVPKARLRSITRSVVLKQAAYAKHIGVLRQCKQVKMVVSSDANAEHTRSLYPTAQPPAVEPLQLMLPISLLTDSYKTTHFLQYPKSRKMVAVSPCALSQAGWKLVCVSHEVGL